MQSEQVNDCLGKIVKCARKSRGLTQSQLAEILGITIRYLKMIENNGQKPSYNLLVCIIKELDIPSEMILLPGKKIP
jgi:transcriptional regulator with XRE-family HTH domain